MSFLFKTPTQKFNHSKTYVNKNLQFFPGIQTEKIRKIIRVLALFLFSYRALRNSFILFTLMLIFAKYWPRISVFIRMRIIFLLSKFFLKNNLYRHGLWTEIKHNKLTKGKFFSNDWWAVYFGSSQLRLRYPELACTAFQPWPIEKAGWFFSLGCFWSCCIFYCIVCANFYPWLIILHLAWEWLIPSAHLNSPELITCLSGFWGRKVKTVIQ